MMRSCSRSIRKALRLLGGEVYAREVSKAEPKEDPKTPHITKICGTLEINCEKSEDIHPRQVSVTGKCC